MMRHRSRCELEITGINFINELEYKRLTKLLHVFVYHGVYNFKARYPLSTHLKILIWVVVVHCMWY